MSYILLFCASLPTLFHTPCYRADERPPTPQVSTLLAFATVRYFGPPRPQRLRYSTANQSISVSFCLLFLPNSIVCTNETQTFVFLRHFNCNMHRSDCALASLCRQVLVVVEDYSHIHTTYYILGGYFLKYRSNFSV
jgi:hypothetical protein